MVLLNFRFVTLASNDVNSFLNLRIIKKQKPAAC